MGFTKVTNCADRSYDHYIDTVKKAKAEGYLLGGFGVLDQLKAADKAILLRHDIDFSPTHALGLAGIERAYGVSSTFFVSLHRPHYAPLTKEMRQTIHALIELGHEIGLHYEPEFDHLEGEIAMLERYMGCKIVAIAKHNPFGSHIDLDKQSKPKNVVDAYGDHVKEFKYISDSSGIWREGCWCGWLGQKDKIQVLTHPEWWNIDTVDPVEELHRINAKWTEEITSQAFTSIENLKNHRERILAGAA